MAKTGSRLILLGIVCCLMAGSAQAQVGPRNPPERRQVSGNLAESLSIYLNGALLKLLMDFRRDTQTFLDEAASRDDLARHLVRMQREASIPLDYLALADLHGNILASSPRYTLPEEWGIGQFPALAEKAAGTQVGYMHYVPALLDRAATLAFIFPVQGAPKDVDGEDEQTTMIMMALLDSRRSFGALMKDRMMLPWETLKIWGPDGDLLYQKGSSSFDTQSGAQQPRDLVLSRPGKLPGERLLNEPSGIHSSYEFSLTPFTALERKVFWHQSVFIGGDRWIVSDIVEKPISAEAIDEVELTGLWVSESNPAARMVSVQMGSSWRMLISLDGQVTRVEGRVLNGQLVSHRSTGVNVKHPLQNVRGTFDANSGRIALHWLFDSGLGINGYSMVFEPYEEASTLPPADANSIRFRINP